MNQQVLAALYCVLAFAIAGLAVGTGVHEAGVRTIAAAYIGVGVWVFGIGIMWCTTLIRR